MSLSAGEVANLIRGLFHVDLAISSWDFLIFLFLGVATFFYALLFVSRGRIVPILLSTYMALILVEFNSFLTLELGRQLGIEEFYLFKLLAFAIAFLLSLFILARVILQSPVGAETFGMPAAFLLALSQVGFLVAVVVSFLPIEMIRELADFTKQVFLGKERFFYWALAPIIFLLIFGRKANIEMRK